MSENSILGQSESQHLIEKKVLATTDASIVFAGEPPISYIDIHRNIVEAVNTQPTNAVIANKARTYDAFHSMLDEMGIVPLTPQITSGENGEILYFHNSSDVTLLEEQIKNNRLQQLPPTARWSSRCFGPRLHCFTDVTVAKRMLCSTDRTIDTLLVIETQGMKDSHEVIVKQAYWEAMHKYAQQYIAGNEQLLESQNTIMKVLNCSEGQAFLNLSFARNMAFEKSGLVIDAYCLLHPQESRLSYRTAIQNNFGRRMPFGYRTYTHESYAEPSTLIQTVEFVANTDTTLSSVEKAKTSEVMKNLIDQITRQPELFIYNPFFQWDGTMPHIVDMKGYVLYSLLTGSTELINILKAQGIDDKEEILSLCNNHFPMEEMRGLFSIDEGIGTDFGSNLVATLATYDPEKHRILSREEKESLISKQDQ